MKAERTRDSDVPPDVLSLIVHPFGQGAVMNLYGVLGTRFDPVVGGRLPATGDYDRQAHQEWAEHQ